MAFTSDDGEKDGVLRARAEDAVRLSGIHGAPYYLPFLDERQRGVVEAAFRHLKATNVCFFGGFVDSERVMAGCFPPEFPPEPSWFPIVKLRFSFRGEVALTHRDFLGALMSAGIKRDKVGDILCGKGMAIVFVDETVAPFLRENVTRVAGESVAVCVDESEDLPLRREYREIRQTVASSRLDGVVKALLCVAREPAADKIASGAVSINHAVCQRPDARVSAGDVISVAGSGRFLIDAVDQQTKKGRLVLCARQCL